jgi:hypothetical protein
MTSKGHTKVAAMEPAKIKFNQTIWNARNEENFIRFPMKETLEIKGGD